MWTGVLSAVLGKWRVWAAAGALLASFAAGWQVNAWRLTSAFGAERAGYEARIAKGWEAALRAYQAQVAAAAEAERQADEAVKRLRKERDTLRTQYQAAVKDDPSCAAQAEQRLRCPRPWL
jgi:hypothetical protein